MLQSSPRSEFRRRRQARWRDRQRRELRYIGGDVPPVCCRIRISVTMAT
jgi:hypothetical protein